MNFVAKLVIGILLLALFSLAPKIGISQTICIDPGHISETSAGCKGKHITEVHANWVIGCELRSSLLKYGYNVLLSKSNEGEVVTNKMRAEIANDSHASLLIRLHCDSGTGTGYAFYVPTFKGKLPNGIMGPSSQVITASAVLAKNFHRGFSLAIGGLLLDNGLKSDDKTYIGSKQGALTGSIYSKVPVVLIEMLVLTNPHDERIMLNPEGRKRIVDALVYGVLLAVPRTS